MAKVMISTIFKGEAAPGAIYKLSPDKLILLVDNPEAEERTKAVKKIKETFQEFIKNITTAQVDEFDVPKITAAILNLIQKEKGNDVFLHLTEGRKTMFLGGLYAASLSRCKAFYLREDNNELYQLPTIDLSLNETKQRILKELDQGNAKMQSIAAKISCHRSLVYNNIKELTMKAISKRTTR